MARYVTVKTAHGDLRGVENLGVASFLGIPYGEAARFHAPQAAAPWTGVREATAFGPAAPQVDTRLFAGGRMDEVLALMYPRTGTPAEGGPMGEDCLVLNIWTPTGSEGTRPVMVWFHGGAFLHGTGAEMMFHGDRLAATGDVVVVTVNHRLGLFGYLPAPEANAGVLDLRLALEWVHDNIAAFGGDPGNVTIFGQSGGAAKVATLMAMPSAAGLFHKAIMQSGPLTRVGTTDEAADLLDRVRHAAGGPLEDLSMRELLDVQTSVIYGKPARLDAGTFAGGLGIGPVLDGSTIPAHPFDPSPHTHVADVPLLIGSTTHDAALMLIEAPGYEELTDADVAENLERDLGSADLLAGYRARHPDEPSRLLWSRIITDLAFRDGSIAIAERKLTQPAAVYMFEFAQPTSILHGALGACHSLDLPYVFNVTDRIPFTGEDMEKRRVAEATSRAWAAFARTGNPTHDGIPAWPAYTLHSRATMHIGHDWTISGT